MKTCNYIHPILTHLFSVSPTGEEGGARMHIRDENGATIHQVDEVSGQKISQAGLVWVRAAIYWYLPWPQFPIDHTSCHRW